MALAIVTRIPTLMEAQIAVAALRAYGIDAQLFDGNFGTMESPVIEALGGFRVMAPEAQVEAARDTLQALRANPAPVDPDEAGPWAPSLRDARRTRGRGMRLLALVLLSAPFVLWLLARLVSGLAPTGDDPDLAHLRLSIEPLALSPLTFARQATICGHFTVAAEA